jgi:hypothetical protein
VRDIWFTDKKSFRGFDKFLSVFRDLDGPNKNEAIKFWLQFKIA